MRPQSRWRKHLRFVRRNRNVKAVERVETSAADAAAAGVDGEEAD